MWTFTIAAAASVCVGLGLGVFLTVSRGHEAVT